jgi:endonuclease YncB( thermonuclease family)
MRSLRVRRRAPAGSRRLRGKLWDGVLTVAILGLLALLAARLDRSETRTMQGRVTVNDGDSLTLGAERIRLHGIDAPEYGQTCQKGGAQYACGRQSREALAALIGGRAVSCSAYGQDRYGRQLATCSAGGVDLNRRQVETGWALAYGDYRVEEDAARRAGAGLWAGSFERPRDWREMHGGMLETEHVLPGLLDWLRSLFRLS